MTEDPYLALAKHAFEHWKPVATMNGWCIRALTIWVEGDRLHDSVAVRDGSGTVYVVKYRSDELVAEFPLSQIS